MSTKQAVMVALVAVGLVISASACKPKSDAAAAPKTVVEVPVRVRTVTASQRPMPRFTTLTGTLAADKESDVAADVSGKILSIPVERGAAVKAGSVLLVLDKRSANITSREAAANVTLATTQAALAKSDCARATGLFKNGAIGEAEYGKSLSQCASSEASVETAKARQEAALQALGDAVIKAPFSGVVSERFVNVGEYVRPDSRIVHLVSSDPLRLRINVPEPLVSHVTQGMRVELQVSSFPDAWFAGQVQYMGAALRESTRDLVVEAVVPNTEAKLRPGMFAVVRVLLPPVAATVVPNAGLRRDGTLHRAFVVHDGLLEERVVEVGASEGDVIEIRKGIAVGEAVVSPVPEGARDGAKTTS
jgi:membrane fusion protein (multidrug efflux system)